MNLKNPILFSLFLVFSIICTPLWAQNKETRNVSDFTGVKMAVPGNLYLKQGNKQEVIIEASDDILERIETEVRGGNLVIKEESNWSWKWWKSNMGKINIYITATTIDYLSVSGSGNMETQNTIKADDVGLAISGSGNMDLDLQAEDLDSRISGSGNMKLRGTADSNEISISGSGDLRAEDLETGVYKVRVSGSGTCRIYAKSEIDMRVSGSGNVYYKGDPDKVYSSVSGSGSLKKL